MITFVSDTCFVRTLNGSDTTVRDSIGNNMTSSSKGRRRRTIATASRCLDSRFLLLVVCIVVVVIQGFVPTGKPPSSVSGEIIFAEITDSSKSTVTSDSQKDTCESTMTSSSSSSSSSPSPARSSSSAKKSYLFYSPGSLDRLIPLSLLYTFLAHVWVKITGIGRQYLPRTKHPLPGSHRKTDPTGNDDGDNKKKIAIVTGANTGIGFATAKSLVVDYGWDVILACRSKDKAIRAMDEINNLVLIKTQSTTSTTSTSTTGKAIVLDDILDLSDFSSVRTYAKAINDKYPNIQIDVLINNAGRNTSGKSYDDLDLMFQANFLGHFLLTNLLMEQQINIDNDNNDDDKTMSTIPRIGKIINLSSVVHHFVGVKKKNETYWKSVALYDKENGPPSYGYGASKLAMILFSQELNHRYGSHHGPSSTSTSKATTFGNFRSIAVNPGGCASDIWRTYPFILRYLFKLVYLSTEQGSIPVIAAAVKEDFDDDVLYVQPYWNFSDEKNEQHRRRQEDQPSPLPPMIPFTEMLGPFVGYSVATPRLPSQGPELIEAQTSLWQVCSELTKL